MRAGYKASLIGAVLSLPYIVASASAAVAQLVQSEIEGEDSSTETTQLVTSSTEVRRAVIGLIAVGVVVALLGILYWIKTGQEARERHASRFGGKHKGPSGAGVPRSVNAEPAAQPANASASQLTNASAALAAAGAQAPSANPPYGSQAVNGAGRAFAENSAFLGGYSSAAAATTATPNSTGLGGPSAATFGSPGGASRPVFMNPDAPGAAPPHARPATPSSPGAPPSSQSQTPQASVFSPSEPVRPNPPPRPHHDPQRSVPPRQQRSQPQQEAPFGSPSRRQPSPKPQQRPEANSPYPDAPVERSEADESSKGGWGTFRRDLFG